MALGPFITYVPPGVYTRTLTEANVANLVAGLRIPVLIGVGQEELEQLDLELVRGSSADIDQQIVNEDATESFVLDDTNPSNPVIGPTDGTKTKIRVRNFPIVTGEGLGRVTNDTRSVTVTINGLPVALASVQGALGFVTLQVPPQVTDVIRVTYFFHRGDTSFTDDVSQQVTATAGFLITPGFAPFAITTGANDKFTLTVNGAEATVTLAQGALTAAGLKAMIDATLIPGLTTNVFTDNNGLDHVQLNASISIVIGSGTANGPLGFTAGTRTNRNATFQVFQRPIVDGTGGGITTTDPSKVVVKVNNAQVLAQSVDGAHGMVTLAAPPGPGSVVTIQYFANTWQDTFDYLPNTLVTSVIRCGISPGRNDYIQGQDFVISNPSEDTSIVHWGASYVVASTQRSPGAEPIDESQVTPTLVDDKLFLAPCARVIDTAVTPAAVSSKEFLLPIVPTTGNGRDTPLGLQLFTSITNNRNALDTNRPDLVVVRVGRNLRDALNRPAATVVAVDGANRKITLKDPVPPDYVAFATFWYNRLVDDTYIITCVTPGPVNVGQYSVFSTLFQANLFQCLFGTKGGGLVDTVNWPRGVENIPDAFHYGGTPVSEIATVTFGTDPAANAAFTNRNAEPYSFYSPFSATWVTKVNGVNQTTNLAAAAKAFLIGAHVPVIQSGPDAGKITVAAGAIVNIEVGTDTAPYIPIVVSSTLPVGNQTPTAIVAQLNADIDAAMGGVNTMANFVQIGPATGDVIFFIKSFQAPGALPGGFDSQSYIAINQGTGEATLGFATFQRASGTPEAINKAATLLGSKTETFNITAGLNDNFKVRVDGIDYAVTLTPGVARTAAQVVTDINAVVSIASVATLVNDLKVRLTSTINTDQSAVIILDGNANDVLGFTQNDSASQQRVTAQEVVDRLMTTGGFAAGAIAYVDQINAVNYITFESLTVGAATSSIAFVSGANSAFNTTTGIGITPGTDGDVGEDAQDNFTVTSNNPAGSAGTGTPGQTYTDARTGLRFTVLPATDGSYLNGGFFTLKMSQTFNVSPSIPTYAFAGLETEVTNLVSVGVNDTGTVQTFNPGGLEPRVGDFYYISYHFMKQDFSTRIFRQLKTIEANFGRVAAENRVTMGAYLAILNGAVLVGIKQVLKVPNQGQASDADFIAAISGLATPLPGNIKPDVMVPLATSTAVYGYLTQHCEIQSNIRNQAERIGMIGFASGTSPTSAQTIAKSLNSNRIIAMYPDSVVITLTNELGENFESLVDGTFFAAAVAGAVVSPAVDVATPYSRRRIQGFTRIPRIMDPVEANQTAVAGITILEDLDPVIRIRQGLTTNMATVLTRLPTVTQIADFVQQQSRNILDSFVGTKFLGSRTNEVEVSMTSLFKQLIQAEIIGAFTGVAAQVSPDDPTVLLFEAFYQPIFPLLYLVLTFNLRARI